MLMKSLADTGERMALNVEPLSEEDSMEGQSSGDALTHLADAVAIQDELAQQRLALEWAKALLDRVLRNWMQLETLEGMAYEDKVSTQVNMVDEATDTLWHLHKDLGRFSRLLKDHRQQLKQVKDPLVL
jgi:arginine deiminase